MDSGNTQVAVKLINSRTSEVNNADEVKVYISYLKLYLSDILEKERIVHLIIVILDGMLSAYQFLLVVSTFNYHAVHVHYTYPVY